jgi:hypothetical protein
MNSSHEATPSSGGKWAIVLFVIALLAFVTESELSQVPSRLSVKLYGFSKLFLQYVQTTLEFRHPFFLLYVSFADPRSGSHLLNIATSFTRHF